MMRCVVTVVFLVSIATARASDPLDTWHWRAGLPQGLTLHGAAVTANLFVAVGESGTVVVSANGIDWFVTNAPGRVNLHAVCHTGARFVAVGDGGAILTSWTGTDWTPRISPTTNDLRSVSAANGLVVAVGYRGTVVTSSTGSSWALQSLPGGTNFLLADVTYGNGRFVAVGSEFVSDYFIGASASSADGLTWERSSTWGRPAFGCVTFGNATFVAVAGGRLWTSIDGFEWNAASLTPAVDLEFVDDRFIGLASSGFVTSTNGVFWTAVPGVSEQFQRIAVGAGRGIAVGQSGRLATSTNLINWKLMSSGPYVFCTDFTFGQGLFVGVGGVYVYSSPDGVLWTSQRAGANGFLNSITYGAGVFVAVGRHHGAITNLISSDGVVWRPLPIPTTNDLNDITFAGGQFLAVGDQGTVCQSTDGFHWTTRFTSQGQRLNSIGYGQGRYVAAGVGALYSSADLQTWTLTSSNDVNWARIEFGNGMFVAGGTVLYGKTGIPMMRSFDGITWEPALSTPAQSASLAFGRGTFASAGWDGLFTSTNGMDWTPRNSWFSLAGAIGFGHETFIATRFPGGLVQSDELVTRPRLSVSSDLEGQVRVNLTRGQTSSVYRIESSSNLKDWTNEVSVLPPAIPIQVLEQTSTSTGQRYYRAVSDE